MTLEEFLRKAIKDNSSLNTTLDENRTQLNKTKETVQVIFVKLLNDGELDVFLKELELSPFNRKTLQIQAPDKEIDLDKYDIGVEFYFSGCSNLISLSLPKIHFITYVSIINCKSLEQLTFTEDHLASLLISSNRNLKSVNLEKCKDVDLIIRNCDVLTDLKLPEYTVEYLTKEADSVKISGNKHIEDINNKTLINKLFLNPDSDKRGAASIHDTGLFGS